MIEIVIGKLSKISGNKIIVTVSNEKLVNRLSVRSFNLSYISIGSLLGTKLVDGRLLILSVEEICEINQIVSISTRIEGTFDEIRNVFDFGTNSYPIIGELAFTLKEDVLQEIFSKDSDNHSNIGTYIYDDRVKVEFNPNVLFGKHLGVFGNTGSGKTCTVVSIIQNYIRNNANKNIKFIVLDVNGEYKTAFSNEEHEFYEFNSLKFHHSILSMSEYGKLFRASEGIQYPALKQCIEKLNSRNEKWDIKCLSDEITSWAEENGKDNNYSKNQLFGYLRTLQLRISSIIEDQNLMSIINEDVENTFVKIANSTKKVHILDLQVSNDSLDIILFLLFKYIYNQKIQERKNNSNHCLLNIVLEEAHRYLNPNNEDLVLANYYIDKIAREGRKYKIGLTISSQIPSLLSYDIVSQCNSIVMHKISNRKDLEFLRNVLRVSNESCYKQMSALEKQHAMVCGEAFPNDCIVKIRDASPLPSSSDPVISDIQ